MTPQEIYNAKLKTDANKRKKQIRAAFKASKMSQADYARSKNMSRSNLCRLLK